MTVTGALNGAVLVLLVVVPLIYPDALPRIAMLTELTAPPTPPPVQTAPTVEVRATHVSSDMMDRQLMAPPRIPPRILMVGAPEPPVTTLGEEVAAQGNTDAAEVFRGADARAVRVQPAAQKQLKISSGVEAGMLIRRTVPVYPAVARAAGVTGKVVLQATIGKDGTIEGLRVVSGPDLLRGAAVDAVRTWVYRPYLLNGQPVEVETTVEVTFTLGG
jgi:protein TonB